MKGRTTAAQLIAELQKLPPDAEVVTSIFGWEGPSLGPVVVEPITVVGDGIHAEPARGNQEGRAAFLLNAPA